MSLPQQPIQTQLDDEIIEKLIFALDIGTRSVIGIVGVQHEQYFKVLDCEILEHDQRAMLDGQIEDIDAVARVAGMVKLALEKRLGVSLHDVCVAAAGRALKTQCASYEIAISPQRIIDSQIVAELEMGAIEDAHQTVDAQISQSGDVKFYCVGHSVVRYYLDDYPILTLLGHKGAKAKVEVIATFLPGEVVESLNQTMAKVGLHISSMTLEPIAAMNAIIPQEIRMLNLALVDIGAGTSDIAISDEGSVVAYTMATVAGDEITEAIIKTYLVDFKTAETIKLHLEDEGEIAYEDILGMQYTLSPKEVLATIAPATEALSEIICKKILEVNGKAPSAVFLVGGGSKLPTLCNCVAANLGMDRSKVAVGSNNYLKRITTEGCALHGPEYATPLGIAITAATARERGGFYVLVNDQKLRLFKESMSVMDVLLISGYRHNQIIGRAGRSLTIELEGEKKMLRGGHGISAQVYVNDTMASISTLIKSGDVLRVTPAQSGQDASCTVGDLLDLSHAQEVSLNSVRIKIGANVYVNGVPALSDTAIQDLDVIKVMPIVSLADLCAQAGIDPNRYKFIVNGIQQDVRYVLRHDDDIHYFSRSFPLAEEKKPADDLVESIISSKLEDAPIHKPQQDVSLDYDYMLDDFAPPAVMAAPLMATPLSPEDYEGSWQAEETLDLSFDAVLGDSQEENTFAETPLRVQINGQSTMLQPKADGASYQFVDMLNFVDIDPSKPRGNIILRLNGQSASYLDLIASGDSVEVYWENDAT